jgi:hypothetical protein
MEGDRSKKAEEVLRELEAKAREKDSKAGFSIVSIDVGTTAGDIYICKEKLDGKEIFYPVTNQ